MGISAALAAAIGGAAVGGAAAEVGVNASRPKSNTLGVTNPLSVAPLVTAYLASGGDKTKLNQMLQSQIGTTSPPANTNPANNNGYVSPTWYSSPGVTSSNPVTEGIRIAAGGGAGGSSSTTASTAPSFAGLDQSTLPYVMRQFMQR